MMTQLRTELHCHSYRSKDSLLLPQALVAAARRCGLDRLAVTDHNTISGALEAQQLAPELIIVGEEILTTQGELLAYFVSKEVPRGLPPRQAIDRLRAQGAVISVSHPFDYTRRGAWSEAHLREILPFVDAIEVFNSRCATHDPNRRASALAHQVGLPGTAGSDAHAAPEIGHGCLLLPDFVDAPGFRRALEHGEVQGRLSSPFVHVYSRYAAWRKLTGWKPPEVS
jgi:predicted metal-dependent phosphoesterase TrpH